MKIISKIFPLSLILILNGCGVSQSKYDKLKAELEECKYGAVKLSAAADKALAEKDYVTFRQTLQQLSEKHPESGDNNRLKELLIEIEREEAAGALARESALKETSRLANLNNTGIWSVSTYVDKFNQSTKARYIHNKSPFKGTFSNSATEDSPLNAEIMIDGPSVSGRVSIQLFEYARNNPVKSFRRKWYKIDVKAKDGDRSQLEGSMGSGDAGGDRIVFNQESSAILHRALLKGGTIKFAIEETDKSTTHYLFSIPNADHYENAHRKLLAP